MSRIARNTSAVGTAFVVTTLLSFVQIKLLTRYLSQDALGEYSAAFALGALVSVLAQVGLPAVVLRFTAKYDALGSPARIRRLFGFAFGLTAALSVVILALVHLVTPRVLPHLYATPPSAAGVGLATGVWLATALRQVVYAVFDGLRRMRSPAMLENLNLAAVTAALVLLRSRLDVRLVLAISLGSGLATLAVALVLLVRRGLGPAPAAVAGSGSPPETAAVVRDIQPFWRGAAVNSIIGIGFGYADKLLVSLFLSFQMVSLFYVAERITFLLKRLLAVPLQVTAPEMTHRWEGGRREELRRDVGFMLKVQFALGWLVTAMVFVAADAAVLLISSPAFLPAAKLLRTLTLSVMLMAFYAPITTLLRAMERIDLALWSDILWLGLYVGLGVLLMPRFALQGIVAAQVAASAATALWNVAAARRAASIAWDVPGMVRVGLSGVVALGPGFALAHWAGRTGHSLWGFVAALLVAVVFLFLLRYTGAFTAADQARLWALAGRPAATGTRSQV
jgi:O-antigen/teichoic acid export membrane protein